jgi:hypothetical protein
VCIDKLGLTSSSYSSRLQKWNTLHLTLTMLTMKTTRLHLNALHCTVTVCVFTNKQQVCPRTVADVAARFQAAVTTVDNILRRVWRARRVAHCLLPWNGRRSLRISAVTTKRRRPVSWKQNAIGNMLYNIYRLSFYRGCHYGELVGEFRFILHSVHTAYYSTHTLLEWDAVVH